MNETKIKKTVACVFLILLTIICIQSIVYSTTVRRADTTIDTLNRELSDARARAAECSRQIEDCTGTINQCHDSVGRIADQFGDDRAELSDIIENLKTVRQEIENMENAINFFYIKYGYIDYNSNNNGGTVE